MELGDEKNEPGITAGYIDQARKIASSKGGNRGDLQFMKLLQDAGIYASTQEAKNFRRRGAGASDIRRIIKSQGSMAVSTAEELQDDASTLTPNIVRPTIRREAQGFETGVNLAPDVQALDARQGEFNRQLTGTTRAFADFSIYLSQFVTRLTGIGAPVAQSRPMTMSQ